MALALLALVVFALSGLIEQTVTIGILANPVYVASLSLVWTAICSARAWASTLVPMPWMCGMALTALRVTLVCNVHGWDRRGAAARHRVVGIDDSMYRRRFSWLSAH
jgi:hypothetical protein